MGCDVSRVGECWLKKEKVKSQLVLVKLKSIANGGAEEESEN